MRKSFPSALQWERPRSHWLPLGSLEPRSPAAMANTATPAAQAERWRGQRELPDPRRSSLGIVGQGATTRSATHGRRRRCRRHRRELLIAVGRQCSVVGVSGSFRSLHHLSGPGPRHGIP